MPKDQGDVKGAQQHAEGQHGDKTYQAILDNAHEQQHGTDAAQAEGSNDFDEFGRPAPGNHRLKEDRQQHDEAEKNSEANRERR